MDAFNNAEDLLEENCELNEILSQENSKSEYGPVLSETVAQSFSKIPTQILSKEAIIKLKETYNVPENCKTLGVPKVNPEIWNNLGYTTKTADARSQFLQQHLCRSLTAQARMADQIMQSAKSITKEIAEILFLQVMNTSSMIGIAIRELNAKRKLTIRPFVQPEYAGICATKSAVTEFLFGDNLEQTLKNVKSSSKIIKPIGTSQLTRQPSRFHPYQRAHQSIYSGTLNYRAPLPARPGSGYQQRPQHFASRGRSSLRGNYYYRQPPPK